MSLALGPGGNGAGGAGSGGASAEQWVAGRSLVALVVQGALAAWEAPASPKRWA